MRLSEQFKKRLQKLAGMDPKKMDPKIKKPFPGLKQMPTGSITGSDSTGSMSYACTPCEGCQPSSSGPFSSLEECEGTCSETNIDTFFDDCPGAPQCAGFNSKEEFCNRCELEYESTQMWAQQNNLPNCDCCDPQIEEGGCTDALATNYDANAVVDNGSCYWTITTCSPDCEQVELGTVGFGGTLDDSLFTFQYSNSQQGTYVYATNFINTLSDLGVNFTNFNGEPFSNGGYNNACDTGIPGTNIYGFNSSIAVFMGGTPMSYANLVAGGGTTSGADQCQGTPLTLEEICSDPEYVDSNIC